MEKDYKQTIEWLTKELTQAQEELKNIKAIEKEHQRINGELREANKLLKKQYISLYSSYCEELKRKNKAIEYIEQLLREEFEITDENNIDFGKKYQRAYFSDSELGQVIEILKGGSDD